MAVNWNEFEVVGQPPAAPPPNAGNVRSIIERAADRYGVPRALALAMADQESSFNPQAVGPATKYGHASGVFQYIPETAAKMGIDPLDPEQASDAAMRQLSEQAKVRGFEWAVAHHHAGPDPRQHGPKTAAYVASIMRKAAKYGGYGGGGGGGGVLSQTVAAPVSPLAGPNWDEFEVVSEAPAPNWNEFEVVQSPPVADTAAAPPPMPERSMLDMLGGVGMDLASGFMRAPKVVPDALRMARSAASHALPDSLLHALHYAPGIGQALAPDEYTDAALASASGFFQRGIDASDDLQPDSYAVRRNAGILERDDAGHIAGIDAPTPEAVIGTVAQSLPQIPQLIAGGGLASGGARALGVAPKLAEALGFGLSNAANVSSAQYADTLTEAGQQPGTSKAEAERRALTAAELTAALSGLTGTGGAAVSARLGGASKSLLGALAKGFAGDAPFEAMEDGGQSLIGDYAMGRRLDYGRAADAGLLSGLAGGASGAALGGIEYAGHRSGNANADYLARARAAAERQAAEQSRSDTPRAASRGATPSAPGARPSAPNAPDADLDALLTRNVLDEADEPADPSAQPNSIRDPGGTVRSSDEATDPDAPFRRPAPTSSASDYPTGKHEIPDRITKPEQEVDATLADGTPVRIANDQDADGGIIEVFDANGKGIGLLRYGTREEGAGSPRVAPLVQVDESMRRKGVATLMYQTARDSGGLIPAIDSRNADRSEDGQAFREGLERKGVSLDRAQTDIGKVLQQRMDQAPNEVATEYDALPDSDGGRILNTDLARELSPEYRADRTRSADVHESASAFIKRRYAEKLAQPTPEGFDPEVLFTAGGTGAGKTSALKGLEGAIGQPEIIYDTNMNTYGSARQKVDQALAAGRTVSIAFVYRDPVDALTNGAIPRAERMVAARGSGRTVPLDEHLKTHAGVRGVMERLAADFASDNRVRIRVIDNSRGKGQQTFTDLASLPQLEENSLRERLAEALEEARRAGLDEALYRGFATRGRPVLGGEGVQELRRVQRQEGGRVAGKSPQELAEQVTPPGEPSPGPSDDGLESTDPLTESAAEASREDGDADADRHGLRAAVNNLLGKEVGDRVTYLRGYAGLPANLRRGVETRNSVLRKGQTAALYDPKTRQVYVFTHGSKDPARAAWNAAHEIAGHDGLRALLGDKLNNALELALQNPTVQALADVIYKQRNFAERAKRGKKTAAELRLESAEEALAELAAAVRTGDFDQINQRYGVPVPDGIRATLTRAIDNFLRRLKALFDKQGVVFKDAEVRELLEAAWQAVDGGVEARLDTPLPADGDALESVDYTPEQQEFMRKAGVGPDTRKTVQKIKDWLAGKIPNIEKDAFVQGALDHYYGLKQAVTKTGNIAIEDDPYVAARMVNIASTMEAILRHGAPKMQKGVLRVDRSIPGLYDALKPVHGNLPGFFGWMVARRANLLKSQGRENLMSDADIRAGLSLIDGNEAAFKQAAGDYLRLKNAILDFAEQHGGTIDPVARAAWDHAEYVPFYREGDNAGPGTRKGIANQSSGIRTLKGGEQELRDPLANIVQNFTRLMDSALKNRALLLAVDQLGEPYFKKRPMKIAPATIPLDQVKKHLVTQGVDQDTIDAMPAAALKGVGRMLSIETPTDDNVVRVMRDGKAEYYEVADPLLLRSLTAMHERPDAVWIKPLVWSKNLLTAGATATPEFIIRNTLRDTGEATVTAREHFIPVWDTMRGAVESVRESELTQDLMMAGSYFHGGLFQQGDFEATARATRRALRKHGMSDSVAEKVAKSLINPKRWWDVYRTGLEATEMGSRVSLARNRMDKTGNFLEAAFEAKDFLDFQLKGDAALMQFFVRVIPFLNARLQGNYRLARAATAKDRRGIVVGRMATLALASAALYAWNMLAYRDEWEKLAEWDRDGYWHFAPGTARHTRIAKPFELGLVAGTAVERGVAALAYQLTDGKTGDRTEQTWKALLRGIMDTMAINPIPQFVKPGAEVFFDYNTFTGRRIESRGDEFKAPSDRHGPLTSETAIQASKVMETMLSEEYALSPKQLEHLWRGYFGGVGMYLLHSSDWVTRKLTDAPETPDMALRDYPGLGAIYRGDAVAYSTRWVDDLYDLRDKAKMRSEQVKAATEAGDMSRARRIESEWGWLLGGHQASRQAKAGFMHAGVREIERAAKSLSELRKKDAKVYASRGMDGKSKRAALDANAVERNRIARELVRRFSEAERSQSR